MTLALMIGYSQLIDLDHTHHVSGN